MRIGTICYATDQGIGHLPKWFYDAGVITDVTVFHHSARVNHPEWYPPGTRVVAQRPYDKELLDWAASMDAMLFFETPFDWSVIDHCNQRGVRTYVVPMYECTPRTVPHQPHRWLCPSKLDCHYFPGSPFVPIPVPPGIRWELRERVTRFLHNGGNLGLRGHKGTLEILQAWKLCRQPIDLTVRAQDAIGLRRLLRQTGLDRRMSAKDQYIVNAIEENGKRLTIDMADRAWEELFDGFDAFVMAEKYNGLSLPLMEARAAGMLVVTSDRFPMNDWLPSWPLIEVERYERACISGAYLEYDEAVVKPEAVAERLDALHDQNVSLYSITGREWAEANSWERLKPVWLEHLSS